MRVDGKQSKNQNFREEDIIFLPESILGFDEPSNSFRKAVLEEGPENTLICWLRPLGHKELVFHLLETHIFYPKYGVKLSARERSVLEMGPEEDTSILEVYSILTIPEDFQKMTANLKAPLVINPENKKASQIVLQESKYITDYPLAKHLSLIFPALKAVNPEETSTSFDFIVEEPAKDKTPKKEPNL